MKFQIPGMKWFRPILASLLCVFCEMNGAGTRLDAAEADPLPCLVLFQLNVGADTKLLGMETVKVIDLLAASHVELPIRPPQSFLEAARRQAEKLDLKSVVKDGRPGSTLTTFAHVPTAAGSTMPRISFEALDGAMNSTSDLLLLERRGQMSSFGKDLGNAAFFLMYYALPELPMQTQAQREAIIEAEIQRNLANVRNGEVLSRKDLSEKDQTIVEIMARSPRNKSLIIRSRYLCNEVKMLSLVSITPGTLPAEDSEAFERMFKVFRFR